MADNIEFKLELTIECLEKILKAVKKREEPSIQTSDKMLDFQCELDYDIRQLKKVIEGIETIDKEMKLIGVQKKNRRFASKFNELAKGTAAKRGYIKIIQDAKRVLAESERKFKLVKDKMLHVTPSVPLTYEDRIVKPKTTLKLNDEIIFEVMQQVIRKNKNKGKDLAKFMLAGKGNFKMSLNYFSQFKFTKSEIDYDGREISFSNEDENDDEDNEDDEDDDTSYFQDSWNFVDNPQDWYRNEKGFDLKKLKNKTLYFKDFLLMKPMSLVFASFIKTIIISKIVDKQYYYFLNSLTKLDKISLHYRENNQIFVDYLLSLMSVGTYEIERYGEISNISKRNLDKINFSLDNLNIEGLSSTDKFLCKPLQTVKTFSSTTVLNEKQLMEFGVENIEKYLKVFPNAEVCKLAFQFDSHVDYHPYLKKSYTNTFKNLQKFKFNIEIRFVIPVNYYSNKIYRKFPGNDRKRRTEIKPIENVTLIYDFVSPQARKTSCGGGLSQETYFHY